MPDPAPDTVELIRAKRDGRALTGDEIRWLIASYTSGAVADEQMSALLMAVYFQGLSPGELRAWTAAMVSSGERLDLGAVSAPTVDKHSTGGVGDKVSLILAPLVASCGAAVPQLSGRGLGHTGGTLDKLESIPGWRAGLTAAEMITVLRSVGCVICAAGSGLAPADRRLYALRDVTGTVESIPLIASSIMSKKIAEGTAALVLDVKVGSGAFMREMPAARRLAQTMVGLGAEAGVRTTALLTSMDVPLGRAVGNAVEVEEAVATLRGEGPPDLVEVTLALAREMLTLAGIGADPAAALADGRALDRYLSMIAAQGGDADAPLPRARHSEVVAAAQALAAAAGRPGRRRGRLAARRGTGAQGGRREPCGRHHLPGQAGRSGGGRPARPRAAHRRRGPLRGGDAGPGRRRGGRPRAASTWPAGDRAHHRVTVAGRREIGIRPAVRVWTSAGQVG